MQINKYSRTDKRLLVPMEGIKEILTTQMIKDFTEFNGHGLASFIRERILNPYLILKENKIDINLLLKAAESDDNIKILLQAYTDRYRSKEAAA